MNKLVFVTGSTDAISIDQNDRRFRVETLAPVKQLRLIVGPLQLVAAEPTASGPMLWAMPGGGRATTEQLIVLAHRNRWKRPFIIHVSVRYRADVS